MKYKNLSSKEVKQKQLEYGHNILPEEKSVPALKIFLSQFINPLVYALGFAVIISLLLQKYFDIALIVVVLLINAITGFIQENKTQKTLQALKKMIKPEAKVLRDNTKQKILASELVP
jgi:Ca2+-transporting ATPase